MWHKFILFSTTNLISKYGTLSTARNLFAQKPVFQANLQIRSVVFDVCQKKKNFSKEIFRLG
jgi:hypothetical protein